MRAQTMQLTAVPNGGAMDGARLRLELLLAPASGMVMAMAEGGCVPT